MAEEEKREAEEIIREREEFAEHDPNDTRPRRENINPGARGTAEGPVDEENQFGNDPVGPNLGEGLDDPNKEGDPDPTHVRNARQEQNYTGREPGSTLHPRAAEGAELFKKDENQE